MKINKLYFFKQAQKTLSQNQHSNFFKLPVSNKQNKNNGFILKKQNNNEKQEIIQFIHFSGIFAFASTQAFAQSTEPAQPNKTTTVKQGPNGGKAGKKC
ncbi:MAG: hypothetical protein HC913_16000 [Microscillaceae bacterium]|nr:hypothetical protein [Microscillaceae bacterium]